jgi:uncharacterized membrane protein HdeD (DUF308 family)
MSALKQQIFGFIGVTGIYTGVLALSFPEQMIVQNIVSIGVVLIIFILSALITSTGTSTDSQANAQKFLLGTTIQMLVALFYLLFAKFLARPYFKSMAIHFLVLFFAFLTVQAFFLVKRARQAK